MRSILQADKECYITGRTDGLHDHHIFFGNGQRKPSERHGFKVWLRPEWHLSLYHNAVHGMHGHDLDLRLKTECQRKYEETHTREEFIKIIGRSYLG